LCRALVKELGADNVFSTDKSEMKQDTHCHFETLDVCDEAGYRRIVEKHNINYIVHMAGILSSLGERYPDLAIDVNVFGAVNALRIARDNKCRIFIPSTIGAFGGKHYQRDMTPVDSILQPQTIYGIGKVFNEMSGDYFARKYEMDFRCLRLPGIVSSEKFAFNGTTDYTTEIFFELLEKGHYNCFVKEDAAMPMMYLDDCIDALVMFLKADPARLKRTVYNLGGIKVVPKEFCDATLQHFPGCTVAYKPDYR